MKTQTNKAINRASEVLAKTKALEDMKKTGIKPISKEQESQLQEFLRNKVQF